MLQDLVYYSSIAVPSVVLLGYLANKYFFAGGVCKSKNRLDGKVVIITGANTGIGYETALDLANRGARVILACRDLKKAQVAADKIMLETHSRAVFVERLDLASFESIREFVKSFKAKFSRLDILINNAGFSGIPYSKTKDGIEMHFGAMHLGHFLLTGLLIDMLKANGCSRVINVSSRAHLNGKIHWDDLQMEKNYGVFPPYNQAKLMNCLFTVQLAKKFGQFGVTAVSLHPGLVRTDIFRDYKGLSLKAIVMTLVLPIFWLTSKSSRAGAQTTIHCAVDSSIPSHNGKYFSDCHVARCSSASKDEKSAERLWEISEKFTGFSY